MGERLETDYVATLRLPLDGYTSRSIVRLKARKKLSNVVYINDLWQWLSEISIFPFFSTSIIFPFMGYHLSIVALVGSNLLFLIPIVA